MIDALISVTSRGIAAGQPIGSTVSSCRPMNSSASVAGEDARGRADGADATRADGAGELQAIELGAAFEQADDVAGVEGVAASGAVDERDGIDAQPDLQRRRRRRRPRARRA